MMVAPAVDFPSLRVLCAGRRATKAPGPPVQVVLLALVVFVVLLLVVLWQNLHSLQLVLVRPWWVVVESDHRNE